MQAVSLTTGQVSVTTVAAALSASSVPIESVVVVADAANSAAIYVGGSNVTTGNGLKIPAGAFVSLDISDLDMVYVVAGSAQSASFLAAKS